MEIKMLHNAIIQPAWDAKQQILTVYLAILVNI